jgi:hypothetical protein
MRIWCAVFAAAGAPAVRPWKRPRRQITGVPNWRLHYIGGTSCDVFMTGSTGCGRNMVYLEHDDVVKPAIEPFAEFAKLQRGVPLLAMWRHRKTATIAWGDGTMLDHGQFDLMLDGDNAMRNELLAILKS